MFSLGTCKNNNNFYLPSILLGAVFAFSVGTEPSSDYTSILVASSLVK